MVRTAFYSALAALGLAVPMATAEAHPPVVVYPSIAPSYHPGRSHYPPAPVCRTWQVMYRTCDREPWRVYRSYDESYRADRAAHHLRHRGFEVFVSVVG